MTNTIYAFVVSNRYISIFILLALLPIEGVMPVAGYLASTGHVLFIPAVVVGTIGSTFGSLVIYIFARLLSQKTLDKVIESYGKWIGLRPKQVERAGRWFDRHARSAVLAGRFVPGLRTAVSLTAGFRQMRPAPFTVYTTIGNFIPCAILAYIGYVAGENFDEISLMITNISSLIGWSLLVLAIAYVFLHKFRH